MRALVSSVRIKRMAAGSAYTGNLPKGCQYCRRGSKMVLLVTGRCSSRCYYCPLSDAKRGKDVVFANERRVRDEEEVLEEARLIGAEGTGITGGDPLLCLQRTLHYLSLLKREFGEGHHVHLYTSTLDPRSFERLEETGLDELRFHPTDLRLEPDSIEVLGAFADSTSMSLGLEVPAIPGEEERMRALVRTAESLGLDFVNINELEFSESNWLHLRRKGFEVRDDISSAVLSSEGTAMALLRGGFSIPLHYCSSSFKDRVQLRNRILRRAERVALPLDLVTEEGTLIKGIVECQDPEELMLLMIREYGVPQEMMRVDLPRGRIEVAPWVLERLAPQLDHDCFVVEEYPTADRLEVERRPLRRR